MNVDSRDFNANLYKIAVAARFPESGYKTWERSKTRQLPREQLQAISSKAKQARDVSHMLPNSEIPGEPTSLTAKLSRSSR